MSNNYVEINIHSGAVMEREYYRQPSGVKQPCQYDPLYPRRQKTEEQRAQACASQSRQRFTRTINTNFTPVSLYVTLTFDDAHLPGDYERLRWIRDNYLRRLRAVAPGMKVVAVMGRGKRSGRFHLHLIIDGVSASAIAEKWTAGSVKEIEPLHEHNKHNGVDYGRDYSGLARYLFDHYETEQGKGKRWYQTKNLEKPEREAPRIPEVVPTLTHPPPAPPGYMLVDAVEFEIPTGRFLRFKYVLIPPPYRPCIVPRFTTVPHPGRLQKEAVDYRSTRFRGTKTINGADPNTVPAGP